MTNEIKDFDAVVREVEERSVEFKVGGEVFEADLNLNAGKMLKWMAGGSSLESIPHMMMALMDEGEYERLVDVLEDQDIGFDVLSDIVVWLAEQMGDSGN